LPSAPGTTDASSNGHVRLNLGAGDTVLDGFVSIDRKRGTEAYPLDCADASVQEIYASHILEHFPAAQIQDVVTHWTHKLVPGGRIRIAVPDFEWIAKRYLEGAPIPSQAYAMGGQIDENDYHHALFDRETLTEVMVNAGLERIGPFKAEINDCASLPVSLNLQGFKPINDDRIDKDVLACLSAPRFAPVMHMRCLFDALARARIPFMIGQGAYWHQVLTQLIEQLLERKPKYILTVDYDTIFTRDDVTELYRLLNAYTEFDGVCAVQMKRLAEGPLFLMYGPGGKPRNEVASVEFDRNITPIDTGHFGLTLFRASAFEKMKRPWLRDWPNDDDRWSEGKTDADMFFWRQFADAGLTVGLANRVVVGHLEEIIVWPGKSFAPVYQRATDWEQEGIPPEVQR
jgi:hypothetical protein